MVYARFGLWKDRKYHLDKMTLHELVAAYFQYYAIQSYLAVAVISIWVTLIMMTKVWPVLAAAAVAVLVYPLIWYLVHRNILHGKFLFRSPLTAAVWKRIHYDHHQDPYDLGVLFGALYTTLPTIALGVVPIGWLIGGPAGAASGLAAGCLVTCIYEFSHCVQHLSYKPKSRFMRHIKTRHLEHHFHNEKGNFGITSFFWDHRFGTYYEKRDGEERSPTVFNLGYTEDMAELYPWVSHLSGGIMTENPRQRRHQA